MKPAPISLLEYFASDLAFSANPKFSPEKPTEIKKNEFGVDIGLQLAPNESVDHRWQLTMEIKHQAAPETNFPYSFRLVLVGFFSVAERVKPEDEERTVKIQGASVLYGMAREIVRAVTGRGPHRPVMLPTVSFYEQSTNSTPPAGKN